MSVPPVTSRTPLRSKPVGEGPGVVHDPGRIVGEGGAAGFGQGHGLGRHHVGQRTAEDHRAPFVHVGGVLLRAQHQATPRAAQRLVRRRGHDVGVGNRVEIPGEHLSGHQPGEVGHVDHEGGTDLVGDVGQDGEVGVPRIGRVPGHEHQRAELPGLGGDGPVVEEAGGGIDPVAGLVEQLSRDVGPEPVGQMPAGVERHPHHALGVEPAA